MNPELPKSNWQAKAKDTRSDPVSLRKGIAEIAFDHKDMDGNATISIIATS
jgi:hypothetical protein